MKQQKKEVIENKFITAAPFGRRLGAFAFDALLMVVTFFLFSVILRPIMNATVDLKTKVSLYEANMKKSHLVYLDHQLDEGIPIEEIKITSNTIQPGDYAKRTYLFYTDFLANNYPKEDMYSEIWYIVNILKIDDEDSLFEELFVLEENENNSETSELTPKIPYFLLSEELSEEEPTTSEDTSVEDSSETADVPSTEPVDRFVPPNVVIKDGVDDKTLGQFNQTIFKNAISEFNNLTPHREMQMYLTIETLSNIVLTTTIFVLLIPMLTKNGQSLGKMIFKLSITNQYGYRIKPWQLIVRYLAFLVFEIFSWYLIPMLGLFVSLTLAIFNKKGRSLHDLIAMTRVVDTKTSQIFTTVEEFETAENLAILSEKRPTPVNEENFEERLDESSGA